MAAVGTVVQPLDGNRRLLNRTGAGVAGGLLIILAGSLAAILHIEIPEKNHDIALIMVTTICNAVIGVAGYFFQSSPSASRQSDIIATQASTAATLANTAAASAPVNPDKTVPLAAGDTVTVKADPSPGGPP